MMTLLPGETVESSSSNTTSSSASRMVSNSGRDTNTSKPSLVRRRRSSATIAGFSNSKQPQPYPIENGETEDTTDQKTGEASNATSERGSDTPIIPYKPAHAARLALLCAQNAARMGARTQLSLCPPGRSRRNLQSALRTHVHRRSLLQHKGESETMTHNYYGLDKMLGQETLAEYDALEQEYLASNNATLDAPSSTNNESDEDDASSGDEDSLTNLDELVTAVEETSVGAFLQEEKYLNLREPLFMAAGGSDPSKPTALNTAASGKLPFNRRKLQFFDDLTAQDQLLARNYLKEEYRKAKRRDGVMLARHLRRCQRREVLLCKLKRGEIQRLPEEEEKENLTHEEQLLQGGVGQFPHPMTPQMSAALVLESLKLQPLESLEGMAKCYDGIVAAGVALMESSNESLQDDENDKKQRPSRSEIMTALAPLLITSLEQPSGEVLLQLATLRRMCGTARYQRRFVQRVAPCLVRPPQAAMWCLRHQNDMEPILAATELIFDSAPDVFGKGWYEQGRLLLMDSARKETLQNAAQQLKNLSSEGGDVDLSFGLGTAHRRGKGLHGATTSGKDGPSRGNEPLAEWEVIAVDRQIRLSISHVMSNDWSHVVVATNRDGEVFNRARRPISTPSGIRTRSGITDSPKGLSSPRSPPRAGTASPTQGQSSPGGAIPGGPATPGGLETAFGPSFGPPPVETATENAPPPPTTPLSPPLPKKRPGFDEDTEAKPTNRDPFTPPPPQHHGIAPPKSPRLMSPETITPPRSPTQQQHQEDKPPPQSSPVHAVSATSPRRSRTPPASDNATGNLERVDRAPLSPLSHGPAPTTTEPIYRQVTSSASSVTSTGSGNSQPAHYRMLTSTAAERKRTVAACRALRAQISRFEEAFMQLHGRAPRGAAERAPLATTYAQYREWKRAIRADAACRIQALFRGASTRWNLQRSNDPKGISRVVLTRAGRASFSSASDNPSALPSLSIPSEIGPRDPSRLGLAPMPGPEGFPLEGQTTPTGYVQPRRRTSSGELSPQYGSSSPAGSPKMTFGTLSLPELQARKRDLKQRLKEYDMNFARKHGRMPKKAEKEPIRHLYETYNTLKAQITMMEQAGETVAGVQQPMLTQRSPSPPGLGFKSAPDSGSDDSPSPSPAPAMAARSSSGRRKSSKSHPVPPEPPGGAGNAAAASTPTGLPSQDLAALKVEKGKLHQMLRSYEKDFFKEHRRQVSSFADIKPVASHYRRYKEIKKAISVLQQQRGVDK